MEPKTKKLQKLTLKKEIVSSLDKKELKDLKGGFTTSFFQCSQVGPVCCADSICTCSYITDNSSGY